MLRFVYLIALVAGLAQCRVSRKCRPTFKAMGGDMKLVNGRMLRVPHRHTCNMFSESCCNTASEEHMRSLAAHQFRDLLTEGIRGKLRDLSQYLESDFLIPAAIQRVGAYIEENPEYYTYLTYRHVAEEILPYIVQEGCLKDTSQNQLLRKLSVHIRDPVDRLMVLFRGVVTVRDALHIALQTKLSKECIEAVVKNGLYSGVDFSTKFCQQCLSLIHI